MAFNLGAVIGLKDNGFTAGLKNSAKGVDGLATKLKHTGNEVRRFQKAVSQGIVGAVGRLAGFAAGVFAVEKVAGAVRDWVDAANEGIAADTKLQTIMKNVKGVTAAQVTGLKDYAAQLQTTGVIEDDAIKVGMAQLGTFNLQAATVKKLSAGLADLAVNQYGSNVSGEQMLGLANTIGKAMTGNVGALTRYGVTLTETQKRTIKYGNEAQRAAAIAEALRANFGGLNEAMAKTPAGFMKQIANTWGDI